MTMTVSDLETWFMSAVREKHISEFSILMWNDYQWFISDKNPENSIMREHYQSKIILTSICIKEYVNLWLEDILHCGF